MIQKIETMYANVVEKEPIAWIQRDLLMKENKS